MNVTYHRTTDGTQVEASAALDTRGIIRDGFTMKTNVLLMDGIPDPALAAQIAAGAKDYSAVDKYRREISDAWKNPDAPFAATKAKDAPSTATVYEKYDRQLVDAWR